MSYASIKLESIHVMTSASSSATTQSLTQSVSQSLSQSNSKAHPVLAKKSAPVSTSSPSAANHCSPSASSSLSSPELLRCKRRINFGGLGYALPQSQPATVARRNERERNRVKMVNLGFATLRQHVPNGAKNKKMSKVETLRSAVEYIRQLQQLLGDNDELNCSNGQCADTMQTSIDENWNPSPSTLSSSGTMQSPASVTYACNLSAHNSAALRRSANSPSSPLVTSSPTPSMGSDASSPYDSMDSMERQVSPEEEELFDFTTWFS